jgi:hypothetical protein
VGVSTPELVSSHRESAASVHGLCVAVYCCSCSLGLGQAASRSCGPEQAAVHGYGCSWLHGVCFVLEVSGSSQSRLVVGILCSGKSLSWRQVGVLLGSACPSESESEAQDLLPPRLVVLDGVTADSSGGWLVGLRSQSRPEAGGSLRSQPLSRLWRRLVTVSHSELELSSSSRWDLDFAFGMKTAKVHFSLVKIFTW